MRHLMKVDVESVGKELQVLAKEIAKEWVVRQKQTPHEEVSFTAFGKTFYWGED